MFVKNNLLYSELPLTNEIESVENPYLKILRQQLSELGHGSNEGNTLEQLASKLL